MTFCSDHRGRTSVCLPFCQGGLHQEDCPALESLVTRSAVADALDEAAERAQRDLANEVGGHTSTYSVREWLKALAAEKRNEGTL